MDNAPENYSPGDPSESSWATFKEQKRSEMDALLQITECVAKEMRSNGNQFEQFVSKRDKSKTVPAMIKCAKILSSNYSKSTESAKSCVRDLTHQVFPLLSHRLSRDVPTSNDDALAVTRRKSIVFTCYLMYLTYFLFLKQNGIPVKNHPLLERLIELRQLLRILKPIEDRLKYQLDSLKDCSSKSDSEIKTLQASCLKANPGNFVGVGESEDESDLQRINGPHSPKISSARVADGEDQEDDDEILNSRPSNASKDGVYVPPKVLAVEYNNDPGAAAVKAAGRLEWEKRKLKNDLLVRELFDDLSTKPLKIDDGVGGKSKTVERLMSKIKQRERYEENNFTRLQVTKKTKRELAQLENTKKGISRVDNVLSLDGLLALSESALKKGAAITGEMDPRFKSKKKKTALLGGSLDSSLSGYFTAKKNLQSTNRKLTELLDNNARTATPSPSYKRRKTKA